MTPEQEAEVHAFRRRMEDAGQMTDNLHDEQVLWILREIRERPFVVRAGDMMSLEFPNGQGGVYTGRFMVGGVLFQTLQNQRLPGGPGGESAFRGHNLLGTGLNVDVRFVMEYRVDQTIIPPESVDHASGPDRTMAIAWGIDAPIQTSEQALGQMILDEALGDDDPIDPPFP